MQERECQKLRMEGEGHVILNHQGKEKLMKIKLLILCLTQTHQITYSNHDMDGQTRLMT